MTRYIEHGLAKNTLQTGNRMKDIDFSVHTPLKMSAWISHRA